MSRSPKKSVVILGGGCGGMAAAYWLSATEELRQRYDVTVYQHGWRLGGKGASGRNHAFGERIEEHGLHMWFGFYDNAFRILRECYEAWGRVPFFEMFSRQPQLSVVERVERNGEYVWEPWNVPLPELQGCPGDNEHPTLTQLLVSLLKWVLDQAFKVGETAYGAPAVGSVRAAHASAERLHRTGSRDHRDVHAHLAAARHAPPNELLDPAYYTANVRHSWILYELGVAVASGFITDIYPHGEAGYDRINHLDFRDWLMRHGASQVAASSAPVRALYDLGFAFLRGDPRCPQGAAGVAVRILMHSFFASKGGTLWRMNAGMGDAVFAPMYEVLSARGVRFKFFHRATALHLSPTQRLVESIDLDVQASARGGGYNPLVEVKGLPCWPAEPRWDQLVGGDDLARRLDTKGVTLESSGWRERVGRVKLRLGRDFDLVVVATSLGPVSQICSELVDASPAWRAMVENVPTIATQAFQLWVKPGLDQLGWGVGPTVLTAFEEPLDTWADMSHLLKREAWPEDAGVRGVHYFCGPLPDGEARGTGGRDADDRVRRNAHQWLDGPMGVLWPNAVGQNGFDWSFLVDLEDRAGAERLDAQYFRANVDPSERYVLSAPGTTRYRIHPGDADFENVYVAGDWTYSRFNCGCVEAAMESGAVAARAIDGTDAVRVSCDKLF